MICPLCRSKNVTPWSMQVKPQGFFDHFLSEQDLRKKQGCPRIKCPRCKTDVQRYFICNSCGLNWCGACLL